MTEDQTIENEIQAKGLTAPRVMPADIEAAISSEHYFTAADGIAGNAINTGAYVDEGNGRVSVSMPAEAALLTICVLVLHNGFTVLGKSACASPENFDAEVGQKVARDDAINQLWPLLGFELKTKLAQERLLGLDDAKPAEQDFLAGSTACDLTGEGGCEACQ